MLGGWMSVLNEALEFLGLAAGSKTHNDSYELVMPRTRKEQRELADAMRELPDRFAGRVPAHVLEQIRVAAAAGQWERAVDELISALHARGEVTSDQEHEKLRAVLRALDMPGERLDALMGDRRTMSQS
jgi:hypothetical protein